MNRWLKSRVPLPSLISWQKRGIRNSKRKKCRGRRPAVARLRHAACVYHSDEPRSLQPEGGKWGCNKLSFSVTRRRTTCPRSEKFCCSRTASTKSAGSSGSTQPPKSSPYLGSGFELAKRSSRNPPRPGQCFATTCHSFVLRHKARRQLKTQSAPPQGGIWDDRFHPSLALTHLITEGLGQRRNWFFGEFIRLP